MFWNTPARTVLVVEDDLVMRTVTACIFQDEGMQVAEASDSTEAMRLLNARNDIAVVFTDVQMPGGIGGVELANQVSRRWPKVNIIITSGTSLPDGAELPPKCQYFSKPYDPDLMATWVKRMLG